MLTLSALDPSQAYGGYGALAPQSTLGMWPRFASPINYLPLQQEMMRRQAIGPGILPFQVDPFANAQLMPQGAVGQFLSGIAPSLGGLVGGAFGNAGLGTTIGRAAAPLLPLLPFQMDPTLAAFGTGQQSLPQTVLVPQDVQDPELQAASNFVQDAAGAVIKRLHEYLQTHLQKFGALADAIPLVQRAAELYEARDYPRAYAQAYQAYRAVGLVRAKQPDLPNV